MSLHNESLVFDWETPEYVYIENSKTWFWWLGATTLVFICGSILFENYVLAVLCVIAGLVFGTLAKREPLIIEVSLSDLGLRINDVFRPYGLFTAFWIEEDRHGHFYLLLNNPSENDMMRIPISFDVPLAELRDFLTTKLPEEEMKEPFWEQLSEQIGF